MRLFFTMLILCFSAHGTVNISLITKRGSLTNQTAFATNTFLSAEDSEFYSLSIEARSFDMNAEAIDGVTHIDGVSFDFTTTEGKRATLVAPNIAVSCEHLHHNVGETMVFGSHTAIVTRVEFQAFNDDINYDYCFMELDRELPIKPCLLAPKNWVDYFEHSYSWLSSEVPVVVVDKVGNVRVTLVTSVASNGQSGTFESCGLWVGDSGSPVMFIIDETPVLIGVATGIKQFQGISEDLMEVERGWLK